LAEEIKKRAQASTTHEAVVEKQDKKIARYMQQVEALEGSSEEDNEE
jgi:hypothetical protein